MLNKSYTTIVNFVFDAWSRLYEMVKPTIFFIINVRFNLFLIKHFFTFRPYDYQFTMDLLKDSLKSQRNYGLNRGCFYINKNMLRVIALLESSESDPDLVDEKTQKALKIMLEDFRNWWL